jgi:hypothetical protein
MPFILNEDSALHTHLQGMTVSDEKNHGRAVGVWFGQPDIQIRDQSFPYLTIDLIDVVEDTMRYSSGLDDLPYLPEGMHAPEDGSTYISETPLPMALDYQVTSYSRHPRHDRQIISGMYQKVPIKFGGLTVPQDGTIRPMFLLSFAKRDGTEQGKRLFSNVFTVRVLSELLPHQMYTVSKASTVTITYPQIKTDIFDPLTSS